VFIHLPSFEALGIDIKADVSVGLSIAASSLLVSLLLLLPWQLSNTAGWSRVVAEYTTGFSSSVRMACFSYEESMSSCYCCGAILGWGGGFLAQPLLLLLLSCCCCLC
jgi:hypothetical protein